MNKKRMDSELAKEPTNQRTNGKASGRTNEPSKQGINGHMTRCANDPGRKEKTNEQRKKGTNEETKKRKNEKTKKRRNEGTKKRRNEETKKRRDEETKRRRNEETNERTNEQTNKRTSERTSERTDGRTGERMSERRSVAWWPQWRPQGNYFVRACFCAICLFKDIRLRAVSLSLPPSKTERDVPTLTCFAFLPTDFRGKERLLAVNKDICLKCWLFSHLSSLPLRSGSKASVAKDASLGWSSNPTEHPGRNLLVKFVTVRLAYAFIVWFIHYDWCQ